MKQILNTKYTFLRDVDSIKMTFYLKFLTFAAEIGQKKKKISPGHNHFWILDDVTNMDVVVEPRGNSLITLFEP